MHLAKELCAIIIPQVRLSFIPLDEEAITIQEESFDLQIPHYLSKLHVASTSKRLESKEESKDSSEKFDEHQVTKIETDVTTKVLEMIKSGIQKVE